MGRENHEEFGAALAGPAVDVAALTGDFAAYVAASFRQALANGIWGWFDDDLAFTRSWGFDLASINVPVVVWQGGQDRMVPFAHGQWLAAHPTPSGKERPRRVVRFARLIGAAACLADLRSTPLTAAIASLPWSPRRVIPVAKAARDGMYPPSLTLDPE